MSSLKDRALSMIAEGGNRHAVALELGLPTSSVYRWAAGSPSVPSEKRAYKKADRAPCGIEGCANPLYCKGLCVMHYTRQLKGIIGDSPLPLRRAPGTGSINCNGYLVVRDVGHPLATAQGKLLAHRGVLYSILGPGPHPCHWCSVMLPWRGRQGKRICVDHLDFDKLNNDPSNLVASCLDCNAKRTAA